jgi:hypothetical protein
MKPSGPAVYVALAIYGWGAGYDIAHVDSEHTAPVSQSVTALSTSFSASPATATIVSTTAPIGWNNLVTGDFIKPAPPANSNSTFILK